MTTGDRDRAGGTKERAAAARGAATAAPPRRRILAAAALAPVLAGVGAATAHATDGRDCPPDRDGSDGPDGRDPDRDRDRDHGRGQGRGQGGRELLRPVPTAASDWSKVATVLGRQGSLLGETIYRTGYPRHDLKVVSHGVKVSAGLALGSHVAFARYSDGSSLVMGDLTVTETEMQHAIDALHAHDIMVTAVHKHLLSHTPDIWWMHVHGHGHDAVALARGMRAAFDRTGTPPGKKPGTPPRIDLDTKAMDTALGAKGSNAQGIYKSVFRRRETITDGGLLLPSGTGATTAFNFQALGGGRAAVNGDFALIADEVHQAMRLLRRGGIDLVELHNHGLADEPRLFFLHLWAVGDGVRLAKALRRAVDVTNVTPVRELDPED